MAFALEPGLVIRYDFLWKEEWDAGRHVGKDRPCVVILMLKPEADGKQRVLICPITHVAPIGGQSAVPVPPKVAAHLGLDSAPMWIKTDQLNEFSWNPGSWPPGAVPTPDGNPSYGMLPQRLTQSAFDQVRQNVNNRSIAKVNRDTDENTE